MIREPTAVLSPLPTKSIDTPSLLSFWAVLFCNLMRGVILASSEYMCRYVSAVVPPVIVVLIPTFLLKLNELGVEPYSIVGSVPALPSSTVSPAPSAAAALAEFFATVMFRSATSSVVELTVVVVPST